MDLKHAPANGANHRLCECRVCRVSVTSHDFPCECRVSVTSHDFPYYDEYGEPMTPDYRYNEYGEIIPYDPYPQPPPPPKEPKYHYPDDGYDYDNDTYTFTTVESTPEPTPSPVSSDEVQEKDDSGDESMEDVDEFFWRPPPPDLPPRDEARALLKSGGEGCRCFPPRSDVGIPSMVYDQITCPHNNSVIGHMHGAVYRFNENWDSYRARIRRPMRPNRHRSRFCVVWGYPNSERYSEWPSFEGGLRGEFRRPTVTSGQQTPSQGLSTQAGGAGVGGQGGEPGSRGARSVLNADQPNPEAAKGGSKPGTTQAPRPEGAEENKEDAKRDPTPAQPVPEPLKAGTAPRLSREKENKPELSTKPENAPARTSRATIIAERLLPRIGYTPEKKTREHVSPTPQNKPAREAETPLHLPPIAASTPGSIYSRSMMSTSMEFGVRPDVNRDRNFKGKYFDPTTNRTYTYDIRPNFGQRMDQWNAVRN
ncbi:NADP dehydrogenase [ubiquinone] 1 beta subcomplex subunit 5, mitochondrial [Plakobranchus ocellatus]|uniref:NADP dehydrogenase [ubiquinone] 1 beta subcomplex subunit 5, mitochondrial n=1 Tax=Plakobranchus ocellatus TaxID=259542 RepID=A0AAV4B9X7_9GAST|nr:NADP dehydrogenase [ubiquinone] 1 beta subcomplex subunit 5, mitochondrial [Plakobranchus ocellatus]